MSSRFLNSNINITNKLRNYFDGLILSDGHIRVLNDITGSYNQTCKHKEWLDIINKHLCKYSIRCRVDDGFRVFSGFCNKSGNLAYHLWTGSYIEFREMKDRWYQRWYEIDTYQKRFWHEDKYGDYFVYKKSVPKDICLSKECVANWYIGDGSIANTSYNNHTKYQISLATMGFSNEDILFLSECMYEDLDIRCTVAKRRTITISNKRSISNLLNYVKEYEVLCYSYKFRRDLIL